MLTRENYFDTDMQMKYFGSSQVKAFLDCEAMALAEIKGEYKRETSVSLLVGSYVDAHFEGTLDLFMAQNPEIFTQKGELKAQYKQADEIIARLERDDLFMQYMGGEKQVIKTGELFGHLFKIRIDSYHKDKAIVDLKIMKDFEPVYKEGLGRVSFINAWRYDLQGAIYQAVEGNNLPFFIAGATKQKDATDLALIGIPQYILDNSMKIVEAYIDRFADIKKGLVEPVRCGKCAYCRQTKVLTGIETYEEVVDE